MGITHAFASAKADGGDATLVKPSDWNAAHVIGAATITLAMLANISATQRLIGRNSAGAGVPEEVTASQLFDWVSNTNGVLLTRTAGVWAALANVTTRAKFDAVSKNAQALVDELRQSAPTLAASVTKAIGAADQRLGPPGDDFPGDLPSPETLIHDFDRKTTSIGA